ncbi:MAG: hypothetical protein HY717_08685 [Planctomycetes bacterium]|nr:hypothetical protein [Planctomycetota bacterium]
MTDPVRTTLASALRTLLRPLVRILLRHGVPLGAFMEYAKKVYVDVALKEFGIPGRKPSVSRASVITGLTRKEVARLSEQSEEYNPAIFERYNRAARVITGWIRDKKFIDGRGRPLVLPLEGSAKCFAELVRQFSGDMPSRAVLDELLQVGAVERVGEDQVKLVSRGYVPRGGEGEKEEKIKILGTDVADLIATINHNLIQAPERAFFQRKVAYDNLPVEFLPSLREKASLQSQELLEDLDRLMSRHDRDANPEAEGTGRKRAVLGIYYFEEDFTEGGAEGAGRILQPGGPHSPDPRRGNSDGR